ncbi:MAG: sensor histidine kinase [Polaromonas sp.]|nr:sensor histidine kinase [Polaromonas sp.]
MGKSDRRWLAIVLWGAALAIIAWASYEVAQRVNIRSLREVTSHRLDLYASNLQSEMDRFEYLPPIVSLNEHVIELLDGSGDGQAAGKVNRYLSAVTGWAGASAIYVMNRQGLTLAASNWEQPGSFVNMNFAYRPYFQEAAKGLTGRFYGVGTVSREAGYYFAHAVKKNGEVIGVTAVKVNLERLDAAWGHGGEKIAVADGNGVIFLSSEPNWKYRTMRSLSDETMGWLAKTRQYTEAGRLSPLGLRETRQLEDGAAIVQVSAEPIEHHRLNSAMDYLVQKSRVPGTDWHLLVFSELAPSQVSARISAALSTLIFALAALVVLYVQQRRRFVAQTVAARAALEQANDQLEGHVRERTQALRTANEQLQGEIGERKRAEETLRATLEDLVHTARMAVLGQMSAGITHELNQPLAALRTLSGNAVVFLARGQQEEAASNLRIIGQLTDHMGKITSQLKKFARKSMVDLRPVHVPSVASDAMFLLGQSMELSRVRIEQHYAPNELTALCDANLLEQVLLNLLTNAFDAVSDVGQPHVLLRGEIDGDAVRIEVHDNGPGIAEHVAPHLFEPFYSTKEQGRGLGLGLAISADIVRKLGGTLTHGRSPALGGALFTVQLSVAEQKIVYV